MGVVADTSDTIVLVLISFMSRLQVHLRVYIWEANLQYSAIHKRKINIYYFSKSIVHTYKIVNKGCKDSI